MNQETTYSRAELAGLLGIAQQNVTKGLDHLNAAGLFVESGVILPNGRPEKRYRLEDLSNKWKKRISAAIQQQYTRDAQSLSESSGAPDRAAPAPASYSTAQIAAAAGVTADAIRKRIARGRLTSIRDGGRHLVPTTALVADIKTALCESAALPPAAGSQNTVTLRPDMIKQDTLKRRIAAVTESENRPADKSAEEWYAEVAARYEVSTPTIYRWITEVRGMRGSKQVIEAAGVQVTVSAASCSRETIDYLIGLFLQNVRQVRYDLFKAVREKAASEGWRVGSDQTLYRILDEVRRQVPGLITQARGGRLAMEKELSPAMRRDLLAFEALEMLVGDQHIFDWLVRDDHGNAIRPECYAFFDMRSRMWLGFAPELGHYNKFTIGRALLDACRYGNPTYIYTDLGKPELSKYLAEVRQNLSVCKNGVQVAAISELRDLRVLENDEPWLSEAIDNDIASDDPQAATDAHTGHRKARGRHPRSKPIEGYFGILERQLYRKLGGLGYCKKQDNPDDNLELEHRLRQDAQAGRLLHYSEFAKAVTEVINWWNMHELSTDKIVPSQDFFENLEKHQKPVFDAQTLDFIFLPTENRKVRDSKIVLDGVEYYAPELSKFSGRFAKMRSVDVKYDPYRPEMCYILEKSTHRFLARAERWDKVNPTIGSQIAERIAAQQSLMKTYTELRNQYTALAPKIKAYSTWMPAAQAAATADDAFDRTTGRKNKVSDEEAKILFINQAARKTA